MLQWIKNHIALLVFAVVAYATLLCHADYLYTIQAESLFLPTKTFMQEVLAEHGGPWAWIGSWCTQFLYYPWLGSLLLLALWAATYFLILGSTGWTGWQRLLAILPQSLLLYLLLCLGYWIYYTKSAGTAFVPTLILFTASLCTWLCTILLTRISKRTSRWTPYALLPLFLVLLSPRTKIYSLTLPDSRLHSEMKMYRAIDQCRWQDAIDEHQKTKHPTNLMVIYKNIALMHSGRLQEMFKTNNCGSRPKPPTSLLPRDTLQLSISRLAAPMIYYQYGQLNYAYQWAMTNAVKHRQSISTLKIMTRCAILNQELDLAERYLMQLKSTRFHKQWAIEQERLLHSSTQLMQSIEFQNIAPLTVDEGNQLDTDNGQCQHWLLNHFADLLHPANPKLEELIITTSLWAKDDIAFDIHFYNYVNAHPNDPTPPLYQEAAILLCNQPSSPVTLDNYPFDQLIADKFNRFVSDYNQLAQQQLTEAETASRLKTIYGDTYWWYFYFYRDFELY